MKAKLMRNEKKERNNLIRLANAYGASENEIAVAAGISKQAVSLILLRPKNHRAVMDATVYPQVPCRICGKPRNDRGSSIQQCDYCLDGTYIT